MYLNQKKFIIFQLELDYKRITLQLSEETNSNKNKSTFDPTIFRKVWPLLSNKVLQVAGK